MPVLHRGCSVLKVNSLKFKRKSGNVITLHTSERHAVVCPPSCLNLTIAIHHSAVSAFNSEHPTRTFRMDYSGLKRNV